MARTPNERQDDTDLRVAVGVIQSQMKRVEDSLGRVETKIDNNSYVHESRYTKDREDDSNTFATKAELRALDIKYKPMLTIGIAIVTTIILGIVTALTAFVINGGLK